MGKRLIWIKTLILSLIIIISTITLVIYCIHILNIPKANYEKKAKVLLNNAIYEAEKDNFKELENFSYIIYNLEGTVTKSNIKDIPEGTKVNIRNISKLKLHSNKDTLTYTSPYVKNYTQIGTIVININYSSINSINYLYYLPLAILLIVILLTVIYLVKFIKRDIIEPVNEIHNTTINILKGKLDQKISYDYDGEIGTLCHDFEELRSSLDYSITNEKKLKEKEKLLLAYISHDLKTPLSIISGYVEGINSGLVKDEKIIKEYTDIILNKTSLLNKLIDDILLQSKTQLNEFTINTEECYSNEFFAEIIPEIKKEVEDNHINFSYTTIPTVLINIDKLRIKQVIQNLIGNSIKFTKPKGEIKMNFQLHDNNILVSVIDNGIGIAAADLPMIFHEFYRGEKARTLNVPGSGLGLSISKYIVEKHNGHIECDSVLNQGTNITFSIPF